MAQEYQWLLSAGEPRLGIGEDKSPRRFHLERNHATAE